MKHILRVSFAATLSGACEQKALNYPTSDPKIRSSHFAFLRRIDLRRHQSLLLLNPKEAFGTLSEADRSRCFI